MRASLGGRHVSGAERIVEREGLQRTLIELSRRPPDFDEMVITVERVRSLEYVEFSLPVRSYSFASVKEAREFALRLLVESGIPEETGRRAISLLSKGPSPSGGVMRGAVVMDPRTGERLERDKERGVRTVRVDWERREEVREELIRRGFTERTLDALAIATKNVHCGLIAELCWSDDPDYTTGYVASRTLGYVRVHPLKERGDPIGGRVYFVNREDLDGFISCVEGKVLLIRGLHSSLRSS